MASSKMANPLRGSWRPRKKMVGPSVGHGVALANGSISMPLKRRMYSPGNFLDTSSRASWDTTQRMSRRVPNQRRGPAATVYMALTPAAWNVPTNGTGFSSPAVMVAPGTSGSCR